MINPYQDGERVTILWDIYFRERIGRPGTVTGFTNSQYVVRMDGELGGSLYFQNELERIN
jgi:hypothetical protein